MTVEEWLKANREKIPAEVVNKALRSNFTMWDMDRFRVALALIPTDIKAKHELNNSKLTVDAWRIVETPQLGPKRIKVLQSAAGVTYAEHIKTTLLHRFFGWFKWRMLRFAV